MDVAARRDAGIMTYTFVGEISANGLGRMVIWWCEHCWEFNQGLPWQRAI